MSIKRVGIVGSGIMGSGIAETAAVHGFEVVLRSRSQSSADAMVAGMEKSLAKQVEKAKRTDQDAALSLCQRRVRPRRARRVRPHHRVGG